MTSFSKKLYNRDPQAAEEFYKNQQFDQRVVYGRHPTLAGFTLAHHEKPRVFGKRQSPPSAQHACDQGCGHPACSKGCVLFVKQDEHTGDDHFYGNYDPE